MSQRILKVHADDNVIVTLKDLAAGEEVTHGGERFTLREKIPAKHKFFTMDMNPGDPVIMYGVLVGKTQTSVNRGGLMDTANVSHAAEPYNYRGTSYQWKAPDVTRFLGRKFSGYHRSDGRVGTANYWLFIPTVFCENRNLDVIREALHNELGYAVSGKYKQYAHRLLEAYSKGESIEAINLGPSTVMDSRVFGNVDGIKFLNHQGGCGGIRQDAAILSKLLAAYADHPNVGGYHRPFAWVSEFAGR